MKPTPDKVVASRGMTSSETRMVNMKKRSAYSAGFQLSSQLKARRGLSLFRHLRILLFSAALCLTMFASLVSFECSTCWMCPALADSVSGLHTSSSTDAREETTAEEDGDTSEYSGSTDDDSWTTEVDGGAAEIHSTTLNQLTESGAVETLQQGINSSNVASRVSRLLNAGRANPGMVAKM
ncbi:UNVERIFIED_CONTAM: Toxoplasma gondii family C protein [Hammondia hammondi]|eukprot:XP_008887930.1 Toxoplasma gondii family C protein [Hammondia hammondi]